MAVSYTTFETKLNLADQYLQSHGKIDCMVIGSSQVIRGFNGEVFAETYRSVSGRDLECWNFGVSHLTGSEASQMADSAGGTVSHPELLIYGLSLRDFNVQSGRNIDRALIQIPWFRYQMGEAAPMGLAGGAFLCLPGIICSVRSGCATGPVEHGGYG